VPQGFLRPIETGFAAMVRLRPLRQQDEDPNLSGTPSGHGLMDGPALALREVLVLRVDGFELAAPGPRERMATASQVAG
jgi:hypothetical protein